MWKHVAVAIESAYLISNIYLYVPILYVLILNLEALRACGGIKGTARFILSLTTLVNCGGHA